MRRTHTWILGLLLLATMMAAPVVASADVELFDFAINLNGTVSMGNSLPGSVNISGFDTLTGLGSITITFAPGAAGNYYLAGYFDHEIDQFVNGFNNEMGQSFGTPVAGQSWEIDEPGFGTGNLFANFASGTLDNGTSPFGPDDVALALGWNFALTMDQSATLRLIVSTTAPVSGFYLRQWDPDSIADGSSGINELYLSGQLNVQGGETVAPEPGTLLLLGSGLLGTIGWTRRRKR